MTTSRRQFLKMAGISTVAAGALPAAAPASTTGWQAGTRVNPAIDNLKVVCCHDNAMVTKGCAAISDFGGMESQNAPVDAVRVQANLDRMAVALAGTAAPGQAWAAILRKPSGKQWSQVRAALKVNSISQNHPRVAIVDKVCKELLALGVPAGSIVIYDGCHNALQHYGAFVGKGLPAGIAVSDHNSLLGGAKPVRIPSPDEGSFDCSADIAAGAIDILVNLALNKGHDQNFGGATLTMKNHFGTFTPRPHGHGTLEYLLAINKSDAIVGGDPVRQQLCIVDSLWAMTHGPGGVPNCDTSRLIMGVFGPAVDYLTVKKIREPVMSAKHNADALARFATEFGYTVEQYEKAAWVELGPA